MLGIPEKSVAMGRAKTGLRTALSVLAAVLAVVSVAGRSASAEEKMSNAFEGPLAVKEPFDKAPLRPVKLPAWLEDVSSQIFGSFDEAVECGAQIAEVGLGDPMYVYYPSKLLPMDPKVKPDDFGNKCEAYAKAGIRVLAALPPRLQATIYAQHPDWRSKDRRDQLLPEVGPDNKYGGSLCMMGPWGDYLIEVLAEAMTMYPRISAYGFDGIHDSGACYCKYCTEAYRKDTGKDIPDPDMNNPEFRRYEQWLNRRMESFVVKLQTRLKGINPDFALVSWTTNAGRFGHFLTVPRNMPTRMNLLFDCPGQEFWLDETNRGNTVVPAFANAYIWAVTNHRQAYSEPYLMSHGNPYGTDSFPPHELYRRVLLTITHGAQSAVARHWRNLHDATRDVFAELRSRAPWLTHKKPEPWAAMLMSDDTNSLYGRDPSKIEERYLSNVLGTFRATLEEHLPTAVINDWNLTAADLAPYKVLVLPNSACMSEEQAEAIRQYVKDGGGLVASLDTSLFDDLGNPRKDFLLADVFGVNYKGAIVGSARKEEIDANFAMGVDESYWEKRKNIFDLKITDHPMLSVPLLEQYIGDKPVVFKGQAVAVEARPDAKVIATMTMHENAAGEMPAVVVNRYGKGRVVYLAGGLDSAYYLYPYPYQRVMLAQAMRWAASEPARIQIQAPMCVQATTFRQTTPLDGAQGGSQRLVVHLYNDVNTAGNHAKPDEDVPLREEVIPISDIKVRFRGYDISRVHFEPAGIDLRVTRTDDGIEVTVPKLEIHGMVVAELK